MKIWRELRSENTRKRDTNQEEGPVTVNGMFRQFFNGRATIHFKKLATGSPDIFMHFPFASFNLKTILKKEKKRRKKNRLR
jgi:hypothetical protein